MRKSRSNAILFIIELDHLWFAGACGWKQRMLTLKRLPELVTSEKYPTQLPKDIKDYSAHTFKGNSSHMMNWSVDHI